MHFRPCLVLLGAHTHDMLVLGPGPWSRIRAAGKCAPAVAKRAADVNTQPRAARVPLSDQELLEQELRARAATIHVPPSNSARRQPVARAQPLLMRSGTGPLELHLKPPRHTRPASATPAGRCPDQATSHALEELAAEEARVCVACPHCGRTLAASRLPLHAPACERRQRPAGGGRRVRDAWSPAYLPRHPVESPSYLTRRAIVRGGAIVQGGAAASRKAAPPGGAAPASTDDTQQSLDDLQQRWAATPATVCERGCNRIWSVQQPCVIVAATVCERGCNRMRSRLQSYVIEAATACGRRDRLQRRIAMESDASKSAMLQR